MSVTSPVWWILGVLFVAVALYLIWFTQRRRRLLEAFAGKHGMEVRPELRAPVQELLDGCFSLGGNGPVRSFGQVSSVVDADAIRFFRTVELLDLNPHGQAMSTHYPRIAALFEAPEADNGFFLLDSAGRIQDRLGGPAVPAPITERARRAAASCSPRHTLSVTFAHGHGLLYFEPVVTGGENASDLEALYCIAKELAARQEV